MHRAATAATSLFNDVNQIRSTFVVYREYRGVGRNHAIFIMDTGYAAGE